MHANMCISVSLCFLFVCGCAFSLTTFVVVVYLFILTCSGLFVFILYSFLCLPVCFLMRETKTGGGFGRVGRWVGARRSRGK